MLHAGWQHQRVALGDVVGLAVAIGAAAAAQHIEHLMGMLMYVGRRLAAGVEDLHNRDERQLVGHRVDHHDELVGVGRRDAGDATVSGAAKQGLGHRSLDSGSRRGAVAWIMLQSRRSGRMHDGR